MADKTMVNVSFPNEVLTQIDRHRAGGRGRPDVKRAAWVAWATAQFIATLGEQEKPAPKPRKIIARPFPAADVRLGADQIARDAALRPAVAVVEGEGARLRAARIAAGLSHRNLAASATLLAGASGDEEVSRDQVQRAERAVSLEQWPALRAWLQAQETKA